MLSLRRVADECRDQVVCRFPAAVNERPLHVGNDDGLACRGVRLPA